VGPPQIPVGDLEKVARGLAAGRRQRQIAEEEGWTPAKVTRCLNHMRDAIVANGADASWLDTRQKSSGEVAQEWLRLRTRT
jgi:hypothetical protein